jgi:hypothetical protein
MTESVDSRPVEIVRIMRTGAVWAAAGIVAPAAGLGPLLASGWRPADLPPLAAAIFWVGTVAAILGLAALIWAGCPALGFPLDQAYVQKVFSIRVGIVLHTSGLTLAALALLLSPG